MFEEFAEPALRARWQQLQLTPNMAQLERLRRTLCMAKPGAQLETSLSDTWFEVCSERISEMGRVQVDLVQGLRQACQAQIHAAEQNLQDSEGLLKQLRDNPPPHSHAVARFFNAQGAIDAPPALATPDQPSVSSLVDLLQAQSKRLANMESELEAARRALNERKLIERAKGALMARMGLTEEAAFRALQKASMDHNRRLVDVAEATLALPDFAFAPPSSATPP